MKFDVVTIGSAAVDFFADTDSELIRIETRTRKEELIAFPLGSKLLIHSMLILAGGGGTNTAVTFARLGLSTAYLGKIGEDGNGDFLLRSLADEGIRYIGPREGQTGMSIILDSINNDRSILAFKGANDQLRPDEIPAFETGWVYMSSMLGKSFDSVCDFIAGQSFKVAFNPSNYQAERGYAGLKKIVDRCTLLVMNREEACKFLGYSYEESPDVRVLMRDMAKLPPAIFVITDGADGVHVYDRKQYYRAWPASDLKVVESTGAGDAFASTFTAMMIAGVEMQQAIHKAMCNAESVLEHKGAKEILLDRQGLESRAARTVRIIEHSDL